MPFNFPNTPTEGQTFSPAPGIGYRYASGTWRFDPPGSGIVYVSDTPPSQPVQGQLWFDSSTGDTFLWYEDIDSGQWVQVNVEANSLPGDIRRYGLWSPDPADALLNTETLIAAYQATVDSGGGTILFPPFAATITAPESTRVAPDEGACLLMGHANGATVHFKGTPGVSALRAASNRLELLAKVSGDWDWIIEGLDLQNPQGPLQLQAKNIINTPNLGIAGKGNAANCAIRQYDGEGVVRLIDVRFFDFLLCQEHIGKASDQQQLCGDVELQRVEYYNFAFGALLQQPHKIMRDGIYGYGQIDSANGNNTDGTTTDPTITSNDPGHSIYVSNRPGAKPIHQTHSNIRADNGVSSPEKLRKGDNIVFTNFSFNDTGRGLEIHGCNRATVSNISGKLKNTADSQQSGFELTGCGNVMASNIVVDASAVVSKVGVRLRADDAEKDFIASIVLGATTTVNMVAAHALVSGQTVWFYDIGGTTQLNGQGAVITVVDTDTFTVPIDSSAFTPYTSGGWVTPDRWANHGNMLEHVTVVNDHANGNAASSFIIMDQNDGVFRFLTDVHLGSFPGRAAIDVRNCRRCTFFMPKKIAPQAPLFAERLIIFDANCSDNLLIWDDSCISVPVTASTIGDSGTNNRQIKLSNGTFLAENGTLALPSISFAAEPGLGFRRAGTNAMRFGVNNVDVLAFLADSMRPVTDQVANLGSSTLAFGRTHTGVMALVDGVAAPTAGVGRAYVYVDTADGDLKVKFGDGVVKVLAADT